MKRVVTQYHNGTFSQAFKRLVCSILALLALVGGLTTGALADTWEWDGVGAVTDANISSNIVGEFTLPYVSEHAVLGYRFTVYDSEGEQVGYSADVDRKTHSYSALKRINGTSKKSHIKLYRAFLEWEKSDYVYDVYVGNIRDSVSVSDDYLYLNTTLPATPTEMEAWLDGEGMSAIDVARKYCKVSDTEYLEAGNVYLVVEPIFLAELNGEFPNSMQSFPAILHEFYISSVQ